MSDEVKYRAVVSDLHLGEGGKLENFVYEAAFLRFLEELGGRGAQAGGRAELVLNGDSVDFLQIAPLAPAPWRTAEQKLGATFKAHPQLFDAFGRFVAAGNRLVILVGNHDIELMFGEVQAAFLDRVSAGSADNRARVVFPNDAELDAKRFRGWEKGPFIYRVNGVHIEHGNQLDEVNCFDHTRFFEDEAKGLLRLPWGSRFVYAVFNEAAAKYRYLDKVRSKTAAALLLWCVDPELARTLLPGFAALGTKLFGSLAGYYLNRQAPAGGGARSTSSDDEPALAIFGEWANELKFVLDHPKLPPPGARGDADLKARLKLLRAALKSGTISETTTEDDGYAARALAIAERENAHTIIFGHTHGARDIRGNGRRYLNTGTWIDRVELDRLAKALEATAGDGWATVEALLEPSNFRSEPRLSYAEIVETGVELRSFPLAGTE
jgi:UDP-2,3-diacylglucosamine pyrophosphatase LpxH